MIPSLVTGTILSVSVDLAPDLPRTTVTLQQDDGREVVFVLPGANGGPPVAVGGVPILTPGQTWQVELATAPVGPVPVGLGAGMDRLDGPTPPPWALSGVHYSPEQLPLVFYLNEAGSADLGFSRTEEIATRALADWSAVGCSRFAFSFGGTVADSFADDGINVLAWDDDDTWEWGAAVAGLTSTRFGLDDDGAVVPVGADILFNGVDWDWLDGGGNPSEGSLDAASVVLHELGHVTGMDHELHLVTSTMYYAYLGGDWQASLAGDDRRGLCENYPTGGHECDEDIDCADIDGRERVCVELDGIRVCDEIWDPVGAVCSLQDFHCEEYCVFGLAFATEGYCSVACEEHEDCPEGYLCDAPSNFIEDSVLVEERMCVQGERPADTGDTGDDGGTGTDGGSGDGGAPLADPPRACGCASASPLSPPLLLLIVAPLARRRRASATVPPPGGSP